MKKTIFLLTLVSGVLLCNTFAYAKAVVESQSGRVLGVAASLTLRPYSNYANEGQVSSDVIVITNEEETAQTLTFWLSSKGESNIKLCNSTVLNNNVGTAKKAFLHLRNTDTGDETLIYNSTKMNMGVLQPGESVSYEICGEMNTKANWEKGDFLDLEFSFSFKKAPVTTTSVASVGVLSTKAVSPVAVGMTQPVAPVAVGAVASDNADVTSSSAIVVTDDVISSSVDDVISSSAVGIDDVGLYPIDKDDDVVSASAIEVETVTKDVQSDVAKVDETVTSEVTSTETDSETTSEVTSTETGSETTSEVTSTEVSSETTSEVVPDSGSGSANNVAGNEEPTTESATDTDLDSSVSIDETDGSLDEVSDVGADSVSDAALSEDSELSEDSSVSDIDTVDEENADIDSDLVSDSDSNESDDYVSENELSFDTDVDDVGDDSADGATYSNSDNSESNSESDSSDSDTSSDSSDSSSDSE